jgi:hypothetical protein
LLREKLARLTVVSRECNSENEATLKDLESKGAALAFCGSYDNVSKLTEIFQDADTVLISTRVNVDIIRNTMPHFLAAAVAAKVQRFVPCEFGVNTFWVEKVRGVACNDYTFFVSFFIDWEGCCHHL